MLRLAVLREAMRETVKRYSWWYLIQGILLIVAGVLAILSPIIASVAIVSLLGWVLIISGVLQAVGLIGASNVPHFWLQLISAVLAILIGVLLLRSPEGGLPRHDDAVDRLFHGRGDREGDLCTDDPPVPNWGWVLGSGLVGIVLAFVLWANMPLSADWVLGFMLGVLLVSEGAALTYLAWQVHKAPAEKSG